MKRLAALAAVAFVAVLAPAADAHPLGNFSTNHLSSVQVSDDRVDVRYVLDQAEVPTVSNRRLAPGELRRRLRDEVASGLRLTVNGRRARLAATEARLGFPRGQAGLRTTRFELELSAAASDPRSVRLRDDTFAGRVGWKAIVARRGDGTAVRTDAPTGDPTNGLRGYPRDLLSSPADRREADFAVQPGSGTLVAPRSEDGKPATSGGGSDGFAALFEDAAAGRGVLVLLLAAALAWGALHALSPGHGKAMVAAYLVGTRGTARDAIVLGATVTVTHTIGVFALGLVTLGLSQYVLPEDLYPWLTLISGLMVVVIGAGVLRSRLRSRRSGGHSHDHHHHHAHHHHDDHDQHHRDAAAPGRRGLIGIGAAAGLIPCPSALVVLLGAVSQHEVGLGLLLILAFSLGLAATLTALGLAVVYVKRLLPRLDLSGPVASAIPALSALLIVGVGLLLTVRAVPGVV